MKSIVRIFVTLMGIGFVGITANCHPEPPQKVIIHHRYHKSNAPENFEPVNRY